MKACITCKEIKSKLEFNKNKNTKDGVMSLCKPCHNLRNKIYVSNNKEKIAVLKKSYRDNNKEKIKEIGKKYRDKNKEEIAFKTKIYLKLNKEKVTASNKSRYDSNKKRIAVRAKHYYEVNKEKQKNYRKIYFENNKEETAITQKKYRLENPERILAAKHKRRALKLNAGGTYTVLDINTLLVNQDTKCVYCKTELILEGKGKYHVDHKMPLFLGGSNYPDNLQLLCPFCNHSKGHKHPDVFEKSIGIL